MKPATLRRLRRWLLSQGDFARLRIGARGNGNWSAAGFRADSLLLPGQIGRTLDQAISRLMDAAEEKA